MAYTPEQQKVVDEAMGGTAASQLSPEAQYYRSYGSFQPIDTSQPSPETAQIQPPTQGLTKVATEGVGSVENLFTMSFRERNILLTPTTHD